MKFIVFAAVFGSALVFAAASPAADTFEQQVQKKQEAAAKHCNATYPVTEDALNKLRTHVVNGETITKTFKNQWCNLLCNLEQLGFYDAQDMEDKCQKAYLAYYRFVEAILIHTLAVDLNTFDAATKEKVIENVLTELQLPNELQGSIAKWLKNNDSVIKQVAEEQNTGPVSAPAPAPAPTS
ncbi:uncharacterized protein LOC135840086 [Planococcus citri]|uniref:uncharacterized protein LOC135840086 n=1 Tax=Planococcus citri TaxID=170843 RepID=UPI0031F8556A